MSHAATVFKGVVHGKTIELEHELGLPEGQSVMVTVQASDQGDKLQAGEGLRRSAGAWADDADKLDAYLAWSREHRKQVRRGLEA